MIKDYVYNVQKLMGKSVEGGEEPQKERRKCTKR
jgi:hypothetical protein